MAINKVIYDGETLMDVTDSTVSEENLLAGAVAYNAAGERILGAVVTAPVDGSPTNGSSNAVSSGGVFAAIGAADHVAASKVTFADGKTFQQKLDSGELKGEQGDKGDTGDTGPAYTLTTTDKNAIAAAVKASLTSETWTFTLEDGSTVTKAVYVG